MLPGVLGEEKVRRLESPMRKPRTTYAKVHAEYVRRFHSQPPSILTEESALELMQTALARGTPISERDLSPEWPDS